MTDLEVCALPADVAILVEDDLDISLSVHVEAWGGGADIRLHTIHYLTALDHAITMSLFA